MSPGVALELLGLLALVFLTWFVLSTAWRFFYTSFLGHALGHSISPKDMGEWAVVTGATDGIGKAYVEELASKGMNVVLVSRTLEKLRNVASSIEVKYPVKTHIIQADFTKGTEIYEHIAKQLEGLEIGVLINNVGMSIKVPERLGQINNVTEHVECMMNCNMMSMTRMTLLVLNQMVARKKGFVLNVSSQMCGIPGPFNTMYSSTKAYIRKFTEDLRIEYAPLGVTVQLVMPGFVITNMIHIKSPTWLVPLPKDFVRSQMKTWGLEYESCGYWGHKLQWYRFQFLKTFFYELGVNKVLTFWEEVRQLELEQSNNKSDNTCSSAAVADSVDENKNLSSESKLKTQ